MWKKKRIGSYKKLFLSFIACLFLISIFQMPIKAQDSESVEDENTYETWLQTIYSRNEGLSVGTANAIATTSDGIIWVGTYAGLYRYNGSKFQLLNQFDTVKSVECLYVDNEDRLWVGTNDCGISIFQNEKLIAHLKMEDGLPSNAIRSIVKASDGLYYIGTSDYMAIVEFKDEIHVVGYIDEILYADKSSVDTKGNIVVTSSYGTTYLVHKGKVVDSIHLNDSNEFTSCVFDRFGNVYLGTSFGSIYIYEIKNQKFEEISKLICDRIRKVNNLIRIHESTIFVCADNGIGYVDSNNYFHHLETANFDSNIYDVIADYQGNLWFSSSRMGLLRLCKTSFIDLFMEYSINSAVINSVERYNGLLYVGSDEGLIVINENDGTQVSNSLTSYLSGVRIRDILKDSKNRLWFCTYEEGLIAYDGIEMKKIDEGNSNIGKRVRMATELRNGNIAVSSEYGISIIENEQVINQITEKDGLKSLINLCMIEMDDGTLMVGSDGDGIAKIKDGKVTIIDTKDGLPSEVILRMKKDTYGDGTFIVTSNSLCYLNADGTIQQLNSFPYSNNYDVYQQDDTVFVLGSAGIYALLHDELLENKEDMHYTFLDSKAGLENALVANSWPLYESEQNKIYLATSMGVTLFDLEEYDQRPSDFLIRVASVTIDGKEESFNGSESLSFSKNIHRLEIKPEIINYSTVDPIILCDLEGFDREPIVMSQSELSTVVYTNLPAGKYKFSMELIDSESGVRISKSVYYIERETNFTETIWFYVLLIVFLFLVAALIGLFVAKKSYTKNMYIKQRELEQSWQRSMTDELTGLKNRVGLRLDYPQFIGKKLTVTMLDVDYFKLFNDTHGHQMGDRILAKVGEVIAQFYQGKDVSYRFGGDEFLLWDFDKTEEEVYIKLMKLKEKVRQIEIEGCMDQIDISFGSYSGVAQTEAELRILCNKADEELYKAKKERK